MSSLSNSFLGGIFMKKAKERMFEKFEAVINHCRNVPIAVFVVLSTIFNYLLGQNIARTNELYSDISSYSKLDFFNALIQLMLL